MIKITLCSLWGIFFMYLSVMFLDLGDLLLAFTFFMCVFVAPIVLYGEENEHRSQDS